MLFRYLAARLRHPGSTTKRFLQAGLGLEHRARHLSAFWSEHLSRSRAAQARWVPQCNGGVLTVLGAGPLRDFNAHALTPPFKLVRLVDGNPLSLQFWRKLNVPIEPVITDITCALDPWCNSLRQTNNSWEQTLAQLRQIGGAAIPAYAPPSDALLSLNILSQLDVGWQEAIEPILIKHYGRSFVQEKEQQWLDALRPGSQTLAEQHLASFESSGAASVLLISDADYVEYTGHRYRRSMFEPPPLTWSTAGWQPDPGIQYEVTPALENVPLNQETFQRLLPSYQLEWQDTWLWHIAPFGTELTDHGKLHRVIACAFRRY